DLVRNLMFRDSTPWWHLLVSWLLGAYISAALTPVMLWLGRRFPLERKRWVQRVALHLVFSVSLAIVHLVVDSAVVHGLDSGHALARPPLSPGAEAVGAAGGAAPGVQREPRHRPSRRGQRRRPRP